MEQQMNEPLLDDEEVSSVLARKTSPQDAQPLQTHHKPSFYLLNNCHLSAAFFLIFTASSSIQTYTSTEFAAWGIGSHVLAIAYISFTAVCLVAPMIYGKLGAKWSMFLSLLFYNAYAVANLITVVYFRECVDIDDGNNHTGTNNNNTIAGHNFTCAMFTSSPFNGAACADYAGAGQNCCACKGGHHPERDRTMQMALLFPAAALCGVFASVLWVAQGAYLTDNGNMYLRAKAARLVDAQKQDKSNALGMFNGIFFAAMQLTQLVGNLLAGAVRHYLSDVYLFAIYAGFSGGGTLLALFLRPVPAPRAAVPKQTNTEQLLATVRLLKSRVLLGLVPTFAYIGCEQAFIFGDFTVHLAQPGLGSANLPYVMAVFGGADVLASITMGKLSDCVGRMPIVIVGVVCHAAVLVASLLLHVPPVAVGAAPRLRTWVILMAAAALWGVGDAVWNTQINAVLGERFKSKQAAAAFANYRMWQGLTMAASFFCNPMIGKIARTAILFVTLGVGVIGYVWSHIIWAQRQKQRQKQ